MRVLLLSCYELGHQPLGLGRPARALTEAGHQVRALDLSAETLDESEVARSSLVAISIPMHTALRLGIQVAQRVRAIHPGCHLVFYGLYAELCRELLDRAGAVSVLGDAAEHELAALATSLEEKRPFAPTPTVVRLGRRDRPSLPRRDGLLPLERYAKAILPGEQRLAGAVETTEGCLHRCLHCPIPAVYQGRFFAISIETVLEDIKNLHARGARHITFADADFLNGPSHARRVVEALHERFPELSFDLTAKVEHLLAYPDLLPFFAERGCAFIVSAVESLSDTVLGHLRKGHTAADVFRALEVVREAGIPWRPSLVSFTPWTKLEDYLDVLDWVDSERLWNHIDPVHYTIRLLVPPGSLLLASEALEPFLGPLDPETMSHSWRHPDPRMDELQAAVHHIVEQEQGKSSQAMVRKIRDRAESYLETPRPSHGVEADVGGLVPHLSESWFCCAEPTRVQIDQAVGGRTAE